jgi:hypothetical protein
MYFANFTDMKGISQDFWWVNNGVFRAFIHNMADTI